MENEKEKTNNRLPIENELNDKQFHVDFEEWIVTAKNEEEVRLIVEERFWCKEYPKICNIEEE